MAFFLLIFGFMLIAAGARGKATDLYGQLESDVQGFVAFGAVVLILGAVGAVDSLRPVAKALLALVFVAFFLKQGKNIISGTQNTVNEKVNLTSSANSADNSGPASSINLNSIENMFNSSGSGSSDMPDVSDVGQYAGYAEIAAELFA